MWKIVEWKSIVMFLILGGAIFLVTQAKYLQNEKDNYLNSISTVRHTAEQDIENFARYNSRAAAKWIWECIKYEIDKHWLKTINEMLETIRNCWSEYRSWWPTWDFFVFDRISWTIVYDWSYDCMKWGERRPFNYKLEEIFLKNNQEKWECFMHQDKNKCLIAIKDLYNIWNTEENSKIYWKFDDSKEWLESYVIPKIANWFEWPIWEWWVFNSDNIQLQVVMWTQEDEVFKNFKTSWDTFEKNKTYWINYITGIFNSYIYLVVLLCLMSIITTIVIKKH